MLKSRVVFELAPVNLPLLQTAPLLAPLANRSRRRAAIASRRRLGNGLAFPTLPESSSSSPLLQQDLLGRRFRAFSVAERRREGRGDEESGAARLADTPSSSPPASSSHNGRHTPFFAPETSAMVLVAAHNNVPSHWQREASLYWSEYRREDSEERRTLKSRSIQTVSPPSASPRHFQPFSFARLCAEWPLQCIPTMGNVPKALCGPGARGKQRRDEVFWQRAPQFGCRVAKAASRARAGGLDGPQLMRKGR